MPFPSFLDKFLLAAVNFTLGVRLIFIAIFVFLALNFIAPLVQRWGLSSEISLYLCSIFGVGLGICSSIGFVKLCEFSIAGIAKRREEAEELHKEAVIRQQQVNSLVERFNELFSFLSLEQLDILDLATKSNLPINKNRQTQAQIVGLTYLLQHEFMELIAIMSPNINLWRINPAIKELAAIKILETRKQHVEEFLSTPNPLKEIVFKALSLDFQDASCDVRPAVYGFRDTLSPCFQKIVPVSMVGILVTFNLGYKEIFESYLSCPLKPEIRLNVVRGVSKATPPLDTD